MRRRILTREGLLRLLSGLEEGPYWVEPEDDGFMIRKVQLVGKGVLGRELNDELIDYLIIRGATL